MPVELIVIAFKGQVLVQDHTPNLKQGQVVSRLVDSASRSDSKNSYSYENAMYHCQIENEVLFLCVTDQQSTTLMAYTLLAETASQFKAQYGAAGVLHPAELNPQRCAPFSSKLQSIAKTYTDNPNHGSKMGKLKNDIEAVKSTMLQNLDDIVQRGGNIDNLCDKTEMLQEDAHVFEGQSRRLKHKMIMRNIKIAIVLFIVVVLLAVIIAMFACGGVTFDKCKSKDDSTQAPGTPIPSTH